MTSKVAQYQFRLLTDEEAEAQATVAVTTYEMYAGAAPVVGGPADVRMGTTEHTHRCPECGHGKAADLGHFGVLKGRDYKYFQVAVAVPDTRRWLRVVSLCCSALVVDPDAYAGVARAKRLDAAAAAVGTAPRKCPQCGKLQPKIEKAPDDHFSFLATYPDAKAGDAKVRLDPGAIHRVFERVPDHVCLAMGRDLASHPRRLQVRCLPIAPNTIRPGLKNFGASGGSSHHDTTNLIQRLVKGSVSLPPAEAIESEDYRKSALVLDEVWHSIVMGGPNTSITQGGRGKRGIVAGTRPIPAILRRLPRKRGRIRDNLLGMRTVRISRTTISGNTRMRINQVGIPVSFARILQVEEVVQEYNLERLMTYFLNGRKAYPGCTRIVKRSTGEEHDVEGLRGDFRLEIGDKIYRDVITGDVALFGRQPTLERSSITQMDVVVLMGNESTFQMNVSACELFNADQDRGPQQVATL